MPPYLGHSTGARENEVSCPLSQFNPMAHKTRNPGEAKNSSGQAWWNIPAVPIFIVQGRKIVSYRPACPA